jgi:hypothetical protein
MYERRAKLLELQLPTTMISPQKEKEPEDKSILQSNIPV